jgi:hypothetical protein
MHASSGGLEKSLEKRGRHVKKLLIGCLVIIVIGVVALAAGGYFLYRAASPMVQSARDYVESMSEMGKLEKDIKNTAGFTAPESGELTDTQMQRFARVQDSVRGALGQRFDEIEAKYKHFKGNSDGRNEPSITEAVSALGDIATVFVQARKFQVNALNQEGFSQAEYSWVRDRVFQAAGMEVTNMIDLKKIEEAVRKGTGGSSIGAPRVPSLKVPEKNRALVKPYLEKMDQWIPLAFFGL